MYMCSVDIHTAVLPLLSLFVCLSPQHYPHREHEGRLVLLGGLSRDVKYIQINIKGCHSDGCDCHIRQIYVRGFQYDLNTHCTHTHTHTTHTRTHTHTE